jgi:hypothetical protein
MEKAAKQHSKRFSPEHYRDEMKKMFIFNDESILTPAKETVKIFRHSWDLEFDSRVCTTFLYHFIMPKTRQKISLRPRAYKRREKILA